MVKLLSGVAADDTVYIAGSTCLSTAPIESLLPLNPCCKSTKHKKLPHNMKMHNRLSCKLPIITYYNL